MIGESGTSKTGKLHRYYKCAGRKRKRNCSKKVEKKDWLEQVVVKFTVERVLTDDNIDLIATRAMELVEKELQDTSLLVGLQGSLKETNKKIKNIMSAIEQGIITPTTKVYGSNRKHFSCSSSIRRNTSICRLRSVLSFF